MRAEKNNNSQVIHTISVQLASHQVKNWVFVINKSSVHIALFSEKVASSEPGEKYAWIKHSLQ